jgi:two-component system, NarL family, response regulator DesR
VIRTLVAEPAAVTSAGLVAILSRESDIDLIGTVHRGEQLIAAAKALRPDVVLLSASFPEHDAIGLAQALRTTLPSCRCAILSSVRRVGDLRRAIAAKLNGYLVQDSPAEFITGAVRELARGNIVIDPALSVLDSAACPLTERETDALRAAARGETNTEIARNLCLTEGTVRNYLSRAITKTGARNRVDAIRIAVDAGWILPI